MLEVEKLTFQYGTKQVLHGIDLQIEPGITAIVGPNAAGKSTLMKCLCGMLRGQGTVRLGGHPINNWEHERIAKRVGYLPQAFAPQAVLTVFETVLLGKLGQLRWHVSADEIQSVDRLLSEMQLSELGSRWLNQLSGGQAQLVAIAQALIRHPEVLLMDEPTSNLDLRKQFDVLSLIRNWTIEHNSATVVAIHDLNLAARFADRVCVLHAGRIHRQGEPRHAITPEMISEVYDVEAQVLHENEQLFVHVLGPARNNDHFATDTNHNDER